MIVLIFVSVNNPVTRSGRMSNVTPFPFEVEMSAVKFVNVVPPPNWPTPTPLHAGLVLLVTPLQITHEAEVPVALKLPLDAAKTGIAPSAATSRAIAKNNVNLFINSFSPPKRLSSQSRLRWACCRISLGY
ncbi:MAG TPA: hypothetical protein VEU62_05435 [Bryobacterales bacterium]|nr:hypothetical protein [Bryobacterales bacterium]